MKNPKEESLHDFLVFAPDEVGDEIYENVRIVSAESPEAAIEQYVRKVVLLSENFQKEISGRVVNNSFSEKFWFQTEEEIEALITEGEVLIDDAEFTRRVRRYFDKRKWSDAYLTYFFSEAEAADFPEEMLLFMWQNSNWSNYLALPMSQILRV